MHRCRGRVGSPFGTFFRKVGGGKSPEGRDGAPGGKGWRNVARWSGNEGQVRKKVNTPARPPRSAEGGTRNSGTKSRPSWKVGAVWRGTQCIRRPLTRRKKNYKSKRQWGVGGLSFRRKTPTSNQASAQKDVLATTIGGKKGRVSRGRGGKAKKKKGRVLGQLEAKFDGDSDGGRGGSTTTRGGRAPSQTARRGEGAIVKKENPDLLGQRWCHDQGSSKMAGETCAIKKTRGGEEAGGFVFRKRSSESKDPRAKRKGEPPDRRG